MIPASSTLASPVPQPSSDEQLSPPNRRDKLDWLTVGALALMHAGCLGLKGARKSRYYT